MVPQLDLDEWLTTIENLHTKDIDLGLERSLEVYNRLVAAGCISEIPYVVTIAGTNGKGTTLQFIENAAISSGLRVGSYTSPHLFRFNERLRLDGVNTADHLFIQAFEQVASHCQSIQLTYYEFTTLAAFVIMSAQHLDLWLLEVGLGGRLDTVNILDADLAVVTSIALDHQAYLGDTREKIALEKIQIARPFGQVFIGGEDVPATILDFVEQNSIQSFDYQSRHLRLGAVSNSINSSQSSTPTNSKTSMWSLRLDHPKSNFEKLPLPKIPLPNAALAVQVWLAIAEALKIEPWRESLNSLLQRTEVFGRFTLWSTKPEIRLDAAHNPAAADLLALTLDSLEPKKTSAVVGIMSDKDIIGTLKPMISKVDFWYIWPLSNSRALPSAALKSALIQLGVPPKKISVAIPADFFNNLEKESRYVVFGSFFTLEAFLKSAPQKLSVNSFSQV